MMMKLHIIIIGIFFITTSSLCCCSYVPEYDYYPYNFYTVDDYGATGDPKDNTQAFERAWKVACASKDGVMTVPLYKTYYVNPISFEGPCKSTTTINLYGTIMAPTSESLYKKAKKHWLLFKNVDRLVIQGGGFINGNGQFWWSKSCKVNKHRQCHTAPTAMTFSECKDLKVSDLTLINAQQMHLTFQRCKNVEATDLHVYSPGDSPNTDGIHVSETRNITIARTDIKTGDDCISIVSGSTNVRATNITCGPGHGISIGSLGAENSEGIVSNVYVYNATLSGSTNGVRIKTWQGGYGYVRNVVFQDITMDNVLNPIIIDQNYCDHRVCHEQGSAVQVSDVKYINIQGTSASEVAVKFDCSPKFPCYGISTLGINLMLGNYEYGQAQALCSNIYFDQRGYMSPGCY